jgi:hypothetical protein
MSIGAGKSKKFCDRWRGLLITKRFSDWNYKIQLKPGKRVVVNVNRMERCHSPPSKKRAFKGIVAKSECFSAGSDSDNDGDSPDITVRSQPLPLYNERTLQNPDVGDEDVTVEATIQLDDTVHDPTWRPVPVIQNRDTSENDQEIPRDSPRYNLRSSYRQNYEAAASGYPLQARRSIKSTSNGLSRTRRQSHQTCRT